MTHSNASRLLTGDSHESTRMRFGTAPAADRYPSRFRPTAKDRRESRALLAAMAGIPSGATVLDLPCGCGRLTPLLVGQGFRVTGADSSPHMVARAQEAWQEWRDEHAETAAEASFEVRDVMQTGYADGTFDAIVCHRLFHHFREPAIRQQALRELGRITRGSLVVSFFNSFALDALRFRLRHAVRRTQPTDRIPIPIKRFAAEALGAGLVVERTVPVWFGISPLWCVVFRRAESAGVRRVAATARSA
jgi:SAM-dependent methyltransferase